MTDNVFALLDRAIAELRDLRGPVIAKFRVAPDVLRAFEERCRRDDFPLLAPPIVAAYRGVSIEADPIMAPGAWVALDTGGNVIAASGVPR